MTTSSTESGGDWSVYQRADGRWFVRYKDPTTGKWRDKAVPAEAGAKTRRQAEGWARDWYTELMNAPVAGEKQTLGKFLDDWLDRRKKNPDIKAATLANNRGHIAHHIKPALCAIKFCDGELKPRVVRDFVISLRDKSTSPRCSKPNAKRIKPPHQLARNTIRNIFATLQDALDDAVGEGLIASNPCRVPLVRDELPDAETRAGENVIVHLPKPVAERLLACGALPEERQTRDLTALTSGARDGELSGLTWADMNLDGEIPTMNINKQLPLKGDNPRPKTKHAHRMLPLHPLAVKALRRWKSGGWVLLVGRHAQPTDPVFPNAEGKPYRPRSAELLRQDL